MDASEPSDNFILTNNREICRLCATHNDHPFTRLTQKTIEKIETLLRITLDPNDEMKFICNECQTNLVSLGNFYKKVQTGQKLIKEIRESQVPEMIKIENIEELEATLLETNPLEELPELNKVELNELLKVDDVPDLDDRDDFLIEIDDDANIPRSKQASYRNKKKDSLINDFYTFICPVCDIIIKTWHEYRSHLIHDHSMNRPKFRCCETSLECERWNLLTHYYYHKSPELLKCKKCDKQFNNIRKYRKHQKEFHVIGEGSKCTCPECGAVVSRKSLPQHLKLHQVRLKLQCDICKLFTSTRSSLILHMKRRHLPQDEGLFLCNICARSFSSKEKFNQHNRYYHDDTTGECPYCGIVKRLEHLRIHIKRVHRENKVTCEICTKEFLNKIKLKGHQLQVHVEPKFECDVCSKKYKTKAKMKEHRATHFGELRFKCDLCDHMNNDYGNMTKHRKTRHRDVPYLPHGTARKVFEIARH